MPIDNIEVTNLVTTVEVTQVPAQNVTIIAPASFNVEIGTAGTQGPIGPAPGLNGTVNVSNLIPGATATASFTGGPNTYTLNLGIPVGAKITSGAGVPAGGTGVQGDWYLNTSTWDYYEKTAVSTWTLRLNLRGATGPAPTFNSSVSVTAIAPVTSPTASISGTNPYTLNLSLPAAPQWRSGSGAPSGALGLQGDWYQNTNITGIGDVYEKTAVSTWTLRYNIRGASGAGNVSFVNGISPDGLGDVTIRNENLVRSGNTGNGGAATQNQWSRIATITHTAAFSNANIMFNVIGGVGLAGGSASVHFGVKTASTLLLAPTVILSIGDNTGITAANFKAVTTVNDGTTVTVELWIQSPNNFDAFYFYEDARHVPAGTAVVTYGSGVAWTASLPGGTQTSPTVPWVDLTTAQTIGGAKTLSAAATFNSIATFNAGATVTGSAPRLTLLHTTNSADGLVITDTTQAGSPRLFFENNQAASANAIYRSTGGLFVTTGATPGSASGTATFQFQDTGTFVATVFQGAGTSITGVVHTISAESIGGVKTFTSNPIISNTGTSTTLGQLSTSLALFTDTATTNGGSEIQFKGKPTATDPLTAIYAAISAPVTSNVIGGTVGYILFSTKTNAADTSLTERMRISNTGLVTMQSGLTVTGTVTATTFAGAGSSITGIVHDTGAEAVSGVKTFANIPVFTNGTQVGATDLTNGYTVQTGNNIDFGRTAAAAFINQIGLAGTINFRLSASSARDTTVFVLSTTGAAVTGTLSASGVITATGGFSGAGASITGVVHTTGAESVAGAKTFSSVVAIGTTGAPVNGGLSVVTDDVSAAPAIFTINPAAAAANVGSRIALQGIGGLNQTQIVSAWTGAATTDAYLAFVVRTSNTLTEMLKLQGTTVTVTGALSVTGAVTATGATFSGLTASRVLTTGSGGLLAVSTVTTTELGFVSGVTSAIQTQINLKAPLASPTFTGTVTGITAAMVGLGNVANAAQVELTGAQTIAGVKTFSSAPILSSLTASTVLTLDGSKNIISSSVTTTELGYVSGVTSAIQTQLNLKAPLASPTFTGTVIVPDSSFTIVKTTGLQTALDGKASTTGGGREAVAALSATTGTATGDLSTASIFTVSPTGNITLAFSNVPATGTSCTLTVIITQSGTVRTVTMPSGTKWMGSTPTQIASKVCIMTLMTVDGGTTWYASAGVEA